MFLFKYTGLYPFEKSSPVFRTIEDNRELGDFLSLYQCDSFKKFVKCSESAWENDESLSIAHEHGLAGEEVVESNELVGVDVLVCSLFEFEYNVATCRCAATTLCTAVSCFHYARSATGNDTVTFLNQLACCFFCVNVIRIVFFCTCRTEYCNART